MDGKTRKVAERILAVTGVELALLYARHDVLPLSSLLVPLKQQNSSSLAFFSVLFGSCHVVLDTGVIAQHRLKKGWMFHFLTRGLRQLVAN